MRADPARPPAIDRAEARRALRRVVVASVVGPLLAYATFAVGFIARPVGGVIFGHFGDRIGRRSMLILALTIMGVATFLIGSRAPPRSALGAAAG